MLIVILAAGYGTRLYPLTQKIAKPLVPINNKPIINFLLDKIAILKNNFAVDEVRVVVNNKFYESFLEWKNKYNVNAEIINDGSNTPDDRLGAVKDMELAIRGAETDCLVLGGDNLFRDNLVKFIKFARSKEPHSSIGLYDVKYKEAARRFGVVLLDGNGKIVRFEEKPKDPPSTLAASCVYFFPKKSLDLLNSFLSQSNNVDASGTYIRWLVQTKEVFGYTLEGEWIDIGHFDSLKEAEKEFKN
ncbi:MAG: nucleotidyltransferase family protein [Omnitrophica bacterium]|nr:nucleotidyltransferase family protein [Candidatus Omnitrophota bacterium]